MAPIKGREPAKLPFYWRIKIRMTVTDGTMERQTVAVRSIGLPPVEPAGRFTSIPRARFLSVVMPYSPKEFVVW